jgi:hypothetical protein
MSTIDFVISNKKELANLKVLRKGNSSDHLPILIPVDKFYSIRKKYYPHKNLQQPLCTPKTSSLYNLKNEAKEGDELDEFEKFV